MFNSTLDRGITVHVSDQALMHLLLAGMEAYKMRKYRGRLPLETCGLLWGFVKDSVRGMDHVTVEHVSTDTAAEREPDSNALNDRTTDIKRQIVQDRWPNLSLLGDFHTHPYSSYSDVMGCKGWEFSKGDFEFFEYDHKPDSWLWDARVSLVLTLAQIKRKTATYIAGEVKSAKHGNVLQWQQCDYRLWLSAYALDKVNGRLVVSPHPAAKEPRWQRVFIDAPTINGTNEWFSYSAED